MEDSRPCLFWCFPVAEGDLELPDDTRGELIRRTGHGVHYQVKKNLVGATQSGDPETDEVEAESESPAATSGESIERTPGI